MRIRLTIRLGRGPVDPAPMFRSGVVTPSRPWLPLLASLAAHAILLGGLALVSSQLADYGADDIDWRAFRVNYIRIRVPEPIYWVPDATLGVSTARRAGRSRSPLAQPERAGSQRDPGRRRGVLPKGIELAPLEASDSETALLQPDSAKPTTPEIELPSLAFWARRDPLAPKPRREQITLPGRFEQPGPAPKLASTPSLAVPNLEANAGETNVPSAASARSTTVTAPASATAPIREQTMKAQAGVFDATAGQGANVIALSPNAYRPDTVVDVPAGSRGARLQNGGEQPAGASGTGIAGAQEKNGGAPGRNSGDSGGGERNSSAPARPALAGATYARHNPTQPDAASGASAPVGKSSAPPDHGGADAFTRIMHPSGGNFDVVVTQSGDQAEVVGASSGLSGSPVYSVYLRVGDEREWVLAFCLPASRESRNSRYEVYVEAPDPISAPYPVRTTIPNSIIGELRSAPLTFHGFITAAGMFRDMAPRQATRNPQELAAAFEQWRFRPATRNKVPVDVEVLLILPAAKDRSFHRREANEPAIPAQP